MSEQEDAARDAPDLVRDALKLFDDYKAREDDNIREAYEDLEFRAGNQWPPNILKERETQGRPCQTINQIPQYVRQVTGDMRQMRPAIKAVPLDDSGSEESAEAMAGVIRYIENRSDSPGIYFQGADAQVTCGIGAWRVQTEYAAQTTFNQEIRIGPIEDAVCICWDLDAVLPTKEDGVHCLVPYDISRAKFKRLYPEATLADFTTSNSEPHSQWASAETVRVGEYWYKKPARKVLAMMPDGSVEDVTEDKERAAELYQQGVRVEKRESFKVFRALVTSREVLEEPKEWPGSYIPIVPVIGEEVRISRRVVRHGVVRFARDPQRMYNYMSSAETEVVALQPKSPFIGTEKNFEQYKYEWETANSVNHAYLPYTPDSANGNAAPQRVPPAVSSQGITEGIERAGRDIQHVIGIYNASLGAASNETSGKAIMARQREGDTGTFVYIDNWSRAIRYTGKILVDLIPKIYDTERVLRIIGEDGKREEIRINQRNGTNAVGETIFKNDVTIGAYDVAIEMGPSYSTKRQEAKDGMGQLIQAVPDIFPAIGDLFVKAQDWPMADKISERLQMMLPPPIKQLESQDGKPIPQMPPDPVQVAAMQTEQAKQKLEQDKIALEAEKLKVEQMKLQVDAEKAQADLEKTRIQASVAMAPQAQPPAPDPRVDQLMQAVNVLQQSVGDIIQALTGPPPGPPPEMPASTQPPPGGFFVPEQPAELPA